MIDTCNVFYRIGGSEMNNVFLNALEFILSVVVIIIARYVVPYIKTKIEASQYAWIAEIIKEAVNAAEQNIQGEGKGERRKDMVTAFVRDVADRYNINISPEQIDTLIESCVYVLNSGSTESDNAVRR